MDISTARKDLAKLVANLPVEGIPLERYGKVVALLVRPEYAPEVVGTDLLRKETTDLIEKVLEQVPKPKTVKTRSGAKVVDTFERKDGTVEGVWSRLPEEFKNSVALTKERQKAKDDLLRRINKG